MNISPPIDEAIKQLRANWGDRAEVYWNESGIVVIEKKSGYVSEFTTATGETRHTGHIK